MSRFSSFAFSFLLIASLFISVSGENKTKPLKRVDHSLNSSELESLKTISEGIQKSRSVALFQGFPRNRSLDPDSFKNPLPTTSATEFHNFLFYPDVITPSKEDAIQLQKIYADRKSHGDSMGKRDGDAIFNEKGESEAVVIIRSKLCGGFHPDWTISWKDGNDLYLVMICFGCDEWKSFGPKSELYDDISPDAVAKLKIILTKYAKLRL